MATSTTAIALLFVASAALAQTPPALVPATPAPPAGSPAPSGGATAVPPPERGIYLEDVDHSADACTDFYQFANGAWRAANPIPPSMQRWSRRWAAGEQNKEQLHQLLEDLSRRTDWPAASIDQQITDFFRSCMDTPRIDALGVQPIAPLLAEIRAMRTKADLQPVLARLHALRMYPLFGISSMQDNHEPTRVIAHVFPGELGLPDRDYYLRPEPRFAEARTKYRAHLKRMFALAGYGPAPAVRASEGVFALEKRLAAAQLDNVALRDPAATDHMEALATLQKSTPGFDWPRYLQRQGLSLGDLNVDQPGYMRAMQRELASTPLATWKSYLAWNVLHSAAPHLASPIATADFDFYRAYLGGAKEMKPRWKRCVEFDDQLLGEALGQRYVERYFPATAKARIQEMVKNLLAAMGDTVQKLDWMSGETKRHALEKLATFNPKVGYPDRWKDYRRVQIEAGSHWHNVEAGLAFAVQDDLAQIGKPLDRGRWGLTPPTSDAYYDPHLNEIVFPAGILQSPAFDAGAVDAVNYGAIGVVIGHEISHGFDDQGAQYDAEGRLHNWWTADDLKRFQQRTQCVADQFEGYFIEPGIHHQGKLVLGESVADLAGAKLAWLAFQKAQQSKPAPTLQGLTPAQQFFIAWGQFRGDATRPETQRRMVQGDPHPVAKFRVIGPVSNLPAFAAAFGCKADSAMVRPPEKPCEVW